MDNIERYKVFVSHNRQQKPWVREAVSQWKSHDLNVFFDEEDIKPGQPVEEEIERGLKNSDYVFLILSPAAVNSYWVAFEKAKALALAKDQKLNKSWLVPVLLKPISRDKMGEMEKIIKSRCWIDLTDPFSRTREYHRLFRLLVDDPKINPPDFPVPESERPLTLREINPLPDISEGTDKGGGQNYADTIQRMNHLFCSTIKALASAVDRRTPHTRGHSERVARIAERIGGSMGLSKRERGELYLAGLLHDIGKIRIKDKDLDLTAPYFEDEGPEMRRHVQIGANCLCSVKELSYILPGIVHHHELWSGNGYPEGRKEKDIPWLARVLAVADSIDSMASRRPNRPPMQPRDIREELNKGRGDRWDPDVVDAALGCFEEIQQITDLHFAIEGEDDGPIDLVQKRVEGMASAATARPQRNRGRAFEERR